jgi:hypothetical protein
MLLLTSLCCRKYQSIPFVMFGINPGYSPINNLKEEIEASKS